jgi:ketosteroid isomerase-like protein
MRMNVKLLLLCSMVALAGTAHAKGGGDIMKDAYAADQAQITKTVNDICDAVIKKDFDRLTAFHAYGPKFTKFEDDMLARQDAAVGKKAEQDAFAGVKAFDAKVKDLKVDVFGQVAVATFILVYTADTGKEKMAGQDRTTLVFAKDGGVWKIVHEHLSPLKTS